MSLDSTSPRCEPRSALDTGAHCQDGEVRMQGRRQGGLPGGEAAGGTAEHRLTQITGVSGSVSSFHPVSPSEDHLRALPTNPEHPQGEGSHRP